MDFEDIPEADESPIVVKQENPYFYEENPLMQASELVEQEPYSFEEPTNVAIPMPAAVPEKSTWEMPEPEADDALTAFNKTWNLKLEVKRAAEAEAEKAVKAKAAEDMANWTTQREIRLHAKKDSNRSEEQILIESLDSEVDAANTWDRVGKLVDVSNDTAVATNADVTRMRKLFIQLKNEPLDSTRGIMA